MENSKRRDYYQKKESLVNEVFLLYIQYQNEIYVTPTGNRWIISEVIDGLIDYVYFLGENQEDSLVSTFLLGLNKDLKILEKLALNLDMSIDAKIYQTIANNILLLKDSIDNGFEDLDHNSSPATIYLAPNQVNVEVSSNFYEANTKQVIRKMY